MPFGRGLPFVLAEIEQRFTALESALDRSEFLSGPTGPIPALGRDGDHYLDTVVGELSRKVAGQWLFLGQVAFDTTVGSSA